VLKIEEMTSEGVSPDTHLVLENDSDNVLSAVVNSSSLLQGNVLSPVPLQHKLRHALLQVHLRKKKNERPKERKGRLLLLQTEGKATECRRKERDKGSIIRSGDRER
jgi:hypothetical protein